MRSPHQRVPQRVRWRYRTGLAAGLALTMVAGVAGATVEDDSAAARADLAALGMEVENPATPGITVPDDVDWQLEEFDVDVELEKTEIWHLRDAQVAARNAARQALQEQEAVAAQRAAQAREAQQAEQSAPQQRADTGGAESNETQAAPATAGQGGERGSLASMVNNLRAQNGLSGLQRDGTLDSVAQNWAQWMASNQTLQHNPNYRSQIGGGWSSSGENIVRNTGARNWSSGDITSWMFNWWANSSVHRANMLNGKYTHVGVGYAMGNGGPYAVLVFGGR